MSDFKTTVKGLFVGTSIELPNGQISAIRKSAVTSIKVFKTYIEGDEVFAKKYHGGDRRVIHHYTGKNYEILKNEITEIESRFKPGSFGENIYTDDWSDDEMCIGDIVSVGSTKLQLTASRRPCATLNVTYEDSRILKSVVSKLCFGWFYRVLEEGQISMGDELRLEDRPYSDLKLSLLNEQGFGEKKFQGLEFLRKCYDTDLLEKGWLPKVRDALKNS